MPSSVEYKSEASKAAAFVQIDTDIIYINVPPSLIRNENNP